MFDVGCALIVHLRWDQSWGVFRRCCIDLLVCRVDRTLQSHEQVRAMGKTHIAHPCQPQPYEKRLPVHALSHLSMGRAGKGSDCWWMHWILG